MLATTARGAAGEAGEAGDPTRLLTVVVHDVAPATLPLCRRLLATLAGSAPLPVTWLVVPRYRGARPDARFERWLDEAVARHDELALHGFTHCDEGEPRGLVDTLRRRWYTAAEGEFAALDLAEAGRRIDAGRRWFAANGWPLRGFVAPAWLMSASTRQALADRGFAYSETLSRLIKLPEQSEFFSQSIVYSTRSAWRRTGSLVWNGLIARAQRRAPLLRIELHPADVGYPAILASWRALLDSALGERRALSVAAAVEELPAALWRRRTID